MANYANLLATIAANIYQNNNNEVTADMVKAAMNAAVASLGAGYQFMGVATTATNPGTPDYKLFYIASEPGTYTNLLDSSSNPLEVADGEVAVLKYDTAWRKEVTGAATAAQVTELGQEVTELCQKVDGINPDNFLPGFINSSNVFVLAGAGVCVKVNAGDSVQCVAASAYAATSFAFLQNNCYDDNEAVFSASYPTRIDLSRGVTSQIYTVPNDCNYLYLQGKDSSNLVVMMDSVLINGKEILNGDLAVINNNTKDNLQSIEILTKQIGEKQYNNVALSPTWNNGGIDYSIVGKAINISSSANYRHCIFPCNAYDIFAAKINQTTSQTYQHYICFIDNRGVVLASFAPVSTAGWHEYSGLVAPEKSAYVYITTSVSDYADAKIYSQAIISLQSQIDNIQPSTSGPTADKLLLTEQTFNLWKINRFNELYDAGETVGYNALVSRVNGHSGLKIAICSDTHFGGTYATTPNESNRRTSERCFRVFDKVANNLCEGAVHCGDISTDYGVAKNRYLSFMREVVERYTYTGNFFITKGNHDAKDNEYQEVNLQDVDFSQNTYYVNNGLDNFQEVTENTWRGQRLYIHKKDLVTDSEFKKVVQKYGCPTSAVWGNGAYYYYDYSSYKIRIIVLNSFAVDNNGNDDNGNMLKWFAETALDLSNKENPQEWSVLIVQHLSLGDTISSLRTELVKVINGFKNASSVSGSYGDIQYSKSYATQGEGSVIGLIHGHKHEYTYDDDNGINDIGMTWTNYYAKPTSQHPNEWGDATKYGISVLCIDTANRKVYNERIDGVSDEWDY